MQIGDRLSKFTSVINIVTMAKSKQLKSAHKSEIKKSLTDIPKRKKKISMVDAYNQGMLANKPVEKISDYFKSVLHTVDKNGITLAQRIIVKQGQEAEQGDLSAAEFLFDRAYGKPTQNIQVETPPQVIVEHQVISVEEAKTVAGEDDKK